MRIGQRRENSCRQVLKKLSIQMIATIVKVLGGRRIAKANHVKD